MNWYLVEADDGLVAVDAGTPADWRLLLEALASLGAPPERLEAVLLTHAHADHLGFAERARSAAGSRVHVHEADAAVARGGPPGRNERSPLAYMLRAQAYRTAIALVRRGAGRIVPVAEVAAFSDGDRIDAPGRPVALHAPGHTPGSCALLLEDRGVLFTGDVLVTWNPMTGRAGPQIMPAAFNRDSRQAMASLSRLEGVSAGILLPGHGEPWTGDAAEAVRLARSAGPS